MDIEKKLKHFIRSIDIYREQIENILGMPNASLSAYILICCLIDMLSVYAIKKDKVGERYKEFIQKYLGSVNYVYRNPKIYNKIYDCIRCSLVHNFTVGKGILLGNFDQDSLHLFSDSNDNLIIDLRSFYSDVRYAVEVLLIEISNDSEVQSVFLESYKKHRPFFIYKKLFLDDSYYDLTGHTISPFCREYKVIAYDE